MEEIHLFDRLDYLSISLTESHERMDRMIKKESMRILNNKLHKMSLNSKDVLLSELMATD
jgi:hypothetical protein